MKTFALTLLTLLLIALPARACPPALLSAYNTYMGGIGYGGGYGGIGYGGVYGAMDLGAPVYSMDAFAMPSYSLPLAYGAPAVTLPAFDYGAAYSLPFASTFNYSLPFSYGFNRFSFGFNRFGFRRSAFFSPGVSVNVFGRRGFSGRRTVIRVR